MGTYGVPPEPHWYDVARKALVATLVAFVVSGGVILAAVADDRVTASEWVTIALALAANIVGPYGVWKARNAPQDQQPGRAAEGRPSPLDVERAPAPPNVLAPHSEYDRDRRPDWWTEPQ